MRRPHCKLHWTIIALMMFCGQRLCAQQQSAPVAELSNPRGQMFASAQSPVHDVHGLANPHDVLPKNEEGSHDDAPVSIQPDQHTRRVLYMRTRFLKSMYIAQGVLQGLDAGSTLRALSSNSGQEANPLLSPLAYHPAAFIALKAAVALGGIWAIDRLHERHGKPATIALTSVNAVYGVVVIHNFNLSLRR